MAFDAVTYSAVQQLRREVGELALVPTYFNNDKYVDTGSFISDVTYPELAAMCNKYKDITDVKKLTLPDITGINELPISSAVHYNNAIVGTDVYLMDNAHRIFKTDTTGSTWTYFSHIEEFTDPYSSYTGNFFYFGSKFYYVTLNTVLESADCITWIPSLDFPIDSACTVHIIGSTLFLIPSGSIYTLVSSVGGTVNITSNRMYSTTDMINWVEITLPSSATWDNVQFNGSVYLINAKGSTATARSATPDNPTWTAGTITASSNNLSVVGDKFLVTPTAASTTAYKSLDGITWTAVTLPASIANAYIVTTTSYYFLISSNLYYSTTGETGSWTVLSGFTANTIRTITNDLIVYFYTAGSGYGYSYTSKFAIDSPVFNNISSTQLATSNSAKSIVGFGTTILYLDNYNNSVWLSSDNGTTWSEQVLPNSFIPTALGYIESASLYIAVASSYTAGYMTSPDGVTWTARVLPAKITAIQSVNYRDGYFAITGNTYFVNGTALTGFASYPSSHLLTTKDGINWQSIPLVMQNTVTMSTNKLCCYFNSKIISFGERSELAIEVVDVSNPYFAKGTVQTYTSGSGLNSQKSIATNGRVVVVVGDVTTPSTGSLPTTAPKSSNIVYSYDAINWITVTIANSGNSFSWDKVLYTGEYFVAVPASLGSAYPINSFVCAASQDGINWTLINMHDVLVFDALLDDPTALKIFSNGGNVFIAVDGVKAIWKVTDTTTPYINYIPSDMPGTKYVIKAVV